MNFMKVKQNYVIYTSVIRNCASNKNQNTEHGSYDSYSYNFA